MEAEVDRRGGIRCWIIIAVFAVLIESVGVWADTPNEETMKSEGEAVERSDLLKKAIELHNRAVSGEDDAADAAVSSLKDFLETRSRNAVALAYLGSSYTLIGRDASSAVNKIRYVNRGIRYLDEAVEISPDDFEVLVVSVNVNKGLPVMFGREKKVLQHSLRLDQVYSSAPTPRQAVSMVPIYEYLRDRSIQASQTRDAETWERKLRKAAELALTK